MSSYRLDSLRVSCNCKTFFLIRRILIHWFGPELNLNNAAHYTKRATITIKRISLRRIFEFLLVEFFAKFRVFENIFKRYRLKSTQYSILYILGYMF